MTCRTCGHELTQDELVQFAEAEKHQYREVIEWNRRYDYWLELLCTPVVILLLVLFAIEKRFALIATVTVISTVLLFAIGVMWMVCNPAIFIVID